VRWNVLRLAFIVVVTLLIAWSTRMPAAQWLEPLQAQRIGQMPLLLARAASLAMLLLIAPTLRRRVLVVALALCTASLAFNAAAVAFALVVIAALRPALPRALVAGALGVVLGVALAQRAPSSEVVPTDARGAALYWEQRDNPFRALQAARAWAASEAKPGEGVLCLARIAERLGDVDDARALRASVEAAQ
jgi:hypothetical protein